MIKNLKIFVFLISVVLFVQATAAVQQPFEVVLSQDTAEIGDIVGISSQIPLKNSHCVYIFMTGPDLPEKGTPIEGDIRNSKVPYDKVFISGTILDYSWDTGLIVGGLPEGRYTLYLSTTEQSPQDLREGTYASAEIEIKDPKNTRDKQSPLPVQTALLSVLIVMAVFCARKK